MLRKTFYLETYGCSTNVADGGRIAGFLESRQFRQVSSPYNTDFILLNTCAVKTPTETKMLSCIRRLSAIAEKSGSRFIVCGCLPKINARAVKEIYSKAILAGPPLKEVAAALNLPVPRNISTVRGKPFNKYISIIPIADGCLGNCSYCCVKNARGMLRSHSIESISERFARELKRSREIWLTAQDTGCYGIDIGSSLPKFLKELLKSEKRFRIRVGMMNPQHLESFYDEYIALFEDERLYRFFHIPIQSGSDKVLRAMNRPYSSRTARKLCRELRRDMPLASISTDVIVGFPGEREEDFAKTKELIGEIEPDVLNISRFGARPNTAATSMPGQLHGRVKKARSRIIAAMQREISLKRNSLFLGLEQEIFVNEAGRKGNFVGRNSSYKAVVIDKDLRGEFAKVIIEKAFPNYLNGSLLDYGQR